LALIELKAAAAREAYRTGWRPDNIAAQNSACFKKISSALLRAFLSNWLGAKMKGKMLTARDESLLEDRRLFGSAG
jgi:hypothetical protein